jgi:hypothetical protein
MSAVFPYMRRLPVLSRTILSLVLVALASATPHARQGRGAQPEQVAPETAARRQAERERQLHEQFFQSPGAHFTVLFEGPQDYALASRVLDILEEGYFRVGQALNTFPDRNVTVVLYTEQQFRDITRAPDWAAAAYDGKIRVPLRGALSRPEELRRVLVHELTHAMLHVAVPKGLPAWLNEGLAVNFEPQGVVRAEAELALARSPLPFATLARSFRSLSGDTVRVAYAQSAVAAHKLLQDAGGTTLNLVLQDLADGHVFEEAFEQRYLIPFDTFAAALRSSVDPVGIESEAAAQAAP